MHSATLPNDVIGDIGVDKILVAWYEFFILKNNK